MHVAVVMEEMDGKKSGTESRSNETSGMCVLLEKKSSYDDDDQWMMERDLEHPSPSWVYIYML
jgi:hypothetical protein